MGNATATANGNVCTISLPSNLKSIMMAPSTSGNAQYYNYCDWAYSGGNLGGWLAHQTTLSTTSNPDHLIHADKNGHGIINQGTSPSASDLSSTTTTLTFTHKIGEHGTISDSDLQVSTIAASYNLTVIVVLAEDKYDHNYLDFQMHILVVTE